LAFLGRQSRLDVKKLGFSLRKNIKFLGSQTTIIKFLLVVSRHVIEFLLFLALFFLFFHLENKIDLGYIIQYEK